MQASRMELTGLARQGWPARKVARTAKGDRPRYLPGGGTMTTTTSTKDYVETLNDLIEACKDGEEGFRTAAENVRRSELKSLLNDYAQQRAQFAIELQTEVARMGGHPETSGTLAGAVRRGWMDIKGTATGKDEHEILVAAEHNEDSIVHAYQEALKKDLPGEIRSIVEREYQLLQEAHNRIRSMRKITPDRAR